MAALPSPTQVSGKHSAIYDSYYNMLDPNGFGTIGAMEAARFLKRSGLSDVVLSRVWDLSDPGGRGCLDKAGMFVALKLVALAQAGRDINISNISLDMPPPKMGDIPLPKPVKPLPPSNTPLITSLPPSSAGVDWTVKPLEREKYDKLFDSLQPVNGLIPGNKVKGVLMDSKLPLDTLGKIWDLADQDKDGMLDRHEFVVAMHLVYKALEKHAIPNVLPPELMPPVKRKESSTIGPTLLPRGLDGIKQPELITPAKSAQPLQWVITPDEKAKSDALFIKSDIDRDGFVSGQEIKDVFLQSGVPQPALAHIWALCDIKQSGKLNNEQFALAMWMVARYLQGVEPPGTLSTEMVPPSFRTTKSSEGILENNNTPYSNPELDMVSKDIEELSREKLALEADIQQKEADIKIKTGEIKSLQSELDTLAATLKQLENQKGEAQKRLNDLKAQVDKLRTQATEQAETLAIQEAELTSKKEQLEGLKQEEQRLEQQKNDNAKQLESLTSTLQDTQFNISQAKAMITQLQEQTRQMTDAISACDTAIENEDALNVPDTALRITPEFRDSQYTRVGMVNGETSFIERNGFNKDDPFCNQNGPISAGFQDDPFKSDPFTSNSHAFGSNDPFTAAFPTKSNDAFSSDPFKSKIEEADPFNEFDDKQKNTQESESDKDPFGCDPFAILHAPTRDNAAPARPTSPSPALPPKKSKVPPPRPAPPRPSLPPVKQAVNDPFKPDPFTSGGGSFADFTDFDDKFSNKPIAKPTKNIKTKGLDFTDDPFRDYRYEDPFNICFDDEPPDVKPVANTVDAFGFDTTKSDPSRLKRINENKELKFDPFGLDGRQSAPLPSSDPFVSVSGRASVPLRPSKALNEDQQLAWAAQESLKIEEARKQRQLQEQADLELAIALSKAESDKH